MSLRSVYSPTMALSLILLLAKPDSPEAIAHRAMESYRKAFLTRNASLIARETTGDFAYVDAKGVRYERGPALAQMQRSTASYRSIGNYKQTLVSAKRVKEGVVMIVDSYLEMTIDYHGKPGRVVVAVRGESLLVPRGKEWAYRRVRVLRESTTMPGGSMLDTRP